MSKVIQKISIDKDKAIYIVGFNQKTMELSFRVSLEPNYLQKEIIKVDDKGMIKTNLYYFHVNFLNKFIQEN